MGGDNYEIKRKSQEKLFNVFNVGKFNSGCSGFGGLVGARYLAGFDSMAFSRLGISCLWIIFEAKMSVPLSLKLQRGECGETAGNMRKKTRH